MTVNRRRSEDKKSTCLNQRDMPSILLNIIVYIIRQIRRILNAEYHFTNILGFLEKKYVKL